MLTYTYSGEIGLNYFNYGWQAVCDESRLYGVGPKVTAVKEVSANSRRESRFFKNRC